ncbi:GNAT family N-acetyltransferase [Alkalibacter rhizosphaerae]|uniref:GNAT family N-acetyltransferase n=1 Tax=Alkalibacter rhizosphaerae TaxID=2815577 RepID=A0A974XFH1_9FIRM|nr:GNAT family N-acetyltransferase [Alkalibacter rhizosphaerae]QSX07770.1 GNAT family N-acetyltransferase [Alkalibacter rhizosphaerae]
MTSIFQSERCIIRSFILDDLHEFLDYRNDLEWMKYQGFKGLSKKEYEKALLIKPSLDAGAQFAITTKTDKRLIGDVYLKKEDDAFWIGYTISPLFKRQGYAYEVICSMIIWINQQGDFNIKAAVKTENTPSIKLLEKLGFSQIKTEDDGSIFLLDKKK